MDPEDVRGLLSPYYVRLREQIEQRGALLNLLVSRLGGRRLKQSSLRTRSVLTDGSGESTAAATSSHPDSEGNRVSEPHGLPRRRSPDPNPPTI
jgi:hypothetical protein